MSRSDLKIFRLRRALFTKIHNRFLHLMGAGPFCLVVVWDGAGELYTTTGEPSRRGPVCRPCTRGFEERGVLGPFTCGFGAGAVCERAADAAEVG